MSEQFALQPYQTDDFWPLIAPLLNRVKDRDWEPEDVRAELRKGSAQCWGTGDFDGILITRIETEGATKRCALWIAAGSGIEQGRDLLTNVIEPWAVANGCSYMRLIGRKGWSRVLPDYRNAGIILEKSL